MIGVFFQDGTVSSAGVVVSDAMPERAAQVSEEVTGKNSVSNKNDPSETVICQQSGLEDTGHTPSSASVKKSDDLPFSVSHPDPVAVHANMQHLVADDFFQSLQLQPLIHTPTQKPEVEAAKPRFV